MRGWALVSRLAAANFCLTAGEKRSGEWPAEVAGCGVQAVSPAGGGRRGGGHG